MSANLLAGFLVASIALLTAHAAGAGYVLAAKSGASERWAVVQSVASV